MKFECNDLFEECRRTFKTVLLFKPAWEKFLVVEKHLLSPVLVLFGCLELVFVINIWKIPLGLSNATNFKMSYFIISTDA